MGERHEWFADPFAAFPDEFVGHLRPFLDEMISEVIEAIQVRVPEYARPADDTYMENIYTGVKIALSLFNDRMVEPGSGAEALATTFHRIGRGEAIEGRSLDAFQMALRLGARVAWRRVVSLAESEKLPRSGLAAFGEAIFVHLDEIAAATSAGYTEARLHAAGELQRRRTRLLDLITTDPPASAEAVSDLAHAAQWSVPQEIAVVVTDHTLGEGPEQARPLVPPEFLSRFDQWPGCIVVPDPEGPGRRRAVEQALRGLRAAIGPGVPVVEGARSLRWATEALSLARRGILPDDRLVRCSDHLTTLLLFRDEELIDLLDARYLAPLEQVRGSHQERLAETLLTWFQCGHNANEVAARLGIHPQTVRYRLRQLDELFADQLHDAEARFEMEVALRARSLRRGGGERSAA